MTEPCKCGAHSLPGGSYLVADGIEHHLTSCQPQPKVKAIPWSYCDGILTTG
jgi:hypothetical protein